MHVLLYIEKKKRKRRKKGKKKKSWRNINEPMFAKLFLLKAFIFFFREQQKHKLKFCSVASFGNDECATRQWKIVFCLVRHY